MSSTGIYSTLPQREKLSDQVVDQLEHLIRSGTLEFGDRLPPERELADSFGVSRTVVREAIRSLVAKGLLDVKPGSGAVVSIPDSSLVSESMSMIIRLRAEEDLYPQIFEARRLLEVEFAGLAAQRATEENLLELEEELSKMEQECSIDEAAEFDVDFHAGIARATQNEIYPIILDSVVDIFLEVRRLALSVQGSKEEAITYHRELVERFKSRDVTGARKTMLEHLKSGEKVMKSFLDKQIEDI